MKLQQLKMFLTTLEKGSFSEAALELGSSQSTVSYAVAELEAELGGKLLKRGRFGAEPTELGCKVAIHVRGIFQLTDAVQQEAALAKGNIQGKLRVATFRSAAGKIIPKLIVKLKKQHPDLNVELIELDNELERGRSKRQLVRDHLADIAFIDVLDEQEDDLIAWKLLDDPYRALVLNDDERGLFPWHELADKPLIFCNNTSCSFYVTRYAESLGMFLQPAYDVKEDSTVLRLVSEGLGVGLLPEFAIDTLPDNVKAIPLDELLERPIYVALLPSSLKIPAIRAFLNLLKIQFPDSEVPRLEVKQPIVLEI